MARKKLFYKPGVVCSILCGCRCVHLCIETLSQGRVCSWFSDTFHLSFDLFLVLS